MTCKMATPIETIVFILLAVSLPKSRSISLQFKQDLPLVINTWPVPVATQEAWQAIQEGDSAVNSVVRGCSKCEEVQCRGTVGFGGSPDESGETTLDAMIMNGATYEVGGVGDLRRVKNAIQVAHAVMNYSLHTLIVGESAKEFAVGMGFKEESLTSNRSYNIWKEWTNNKCQPNFRKNVIPDPSMNCGPYAPDPSKASAGKASPPTDPNNHDTIGMIVVDKNGNVASGTSTNGLTYKIPGRVGDSPIAGAGSYASNLGGGAAATGNGDLMMRFLPSYHAVLEMENGASPNDAAVKAISRIIRFYPDFTGALIAANTKGDYAAVCHGYANFTFCLSNPNTSGVQLQTVSCI